MTEITLEKLTLEEQIEFDRYPIVTTYNLFTTDQLRIRRQIANKIRTYILKKNNTKENIEMHKFYTDKQNKEIRRVLEANKNELIVVSYKPNKKDDLQIGGIPIKDVIEIEQWNDKQLSIIKKSSRPGIFCDPLGFTILLKDIVHASS